MESIKDLYEKQKTTKLSSVKMAGTVKPLNVSPLIKCARYSFLILGYFYGSFRLSALRMYESKARVTRHKMLHEQEERRKFLDKERTIQEIIQLGKDFEVTEFPPGWESSL